MRLMRRDFSTAVRVALVSLVSVAAAQPARAQAVPPPAPPAQEPAAPAVEKADDLNSKVTAAVYFFRPDGPAFDLNLRHQFGSLTTWIGAFNDSDRGTIARLGAQDDFRRAWFHMVLTGEGSTDHTLVGQVSTELGKSTVAIVGYSRTNLGNFLDLNFDPNDSVQLGVGHKISSYDKIQAFTIFDVRFHTDQQHTHILWRHKLNAQNGITIDVLYKSGRMDNGEFIRDVGVGIYYDRPTWFWKVYYDPHVQFTDQTMVRTGIGRKF
jgi:hypothetical protein